MTIFLLFLLKIMKELLTLVNNHRYPYPPNYYVGTKNVCPLIPQNIILLPRGPLTRPSTQANVHHRYLLAVNLVGKGEIIVDRIRFSFLPGTSYLVFPHQYHHFQYNQDHVWMFITFELPNAPMPELLRNRVFSPPDCFYNYLKQMIHCCPGTSDACPVPEKLVLFGGLLLNELLILAQSESYLSMKKIELKDEFIDQVNHYIHARQDMILLPEELAEKFGYSISHFRALYKKGMGISLMSYIRRTKLNHSLNLLRNSNLKIGEIAMRSGYDSIYAFSHAFKKHFGQSPAAFRNQSSNTSTECC